MLAGVALRAIYATVFTMHDILLDQIKLLPLPEDLTPANRTWLSPVKLNPDSVSHPTFTALFDQFMVIAKATGKNLIYPR